MINRLIYGIVNDCLMIVDGIDFDATEHGKKLYSNMFKRSKIRYEIEIYILTEYIIWINGPYEYLYWYDISILYYLLITHFQELARVEADDGYIGKHHQRIKC